MNTSLLLVFVSISIVAITMFWIFYTQSNSTHKISQKYLLTALKDQSLSTTQRSELEQSLSSLLLKNNKPSYSFKITFLIAILVIPFSFIFYDLLGNPAAVDYVAKVDKQAQGTGQTQMSMQEAIAQLEARLINNPNDVEGQMLYARSQTSLKNHHKAVTAYRKANELAPNEAVILTELAEAIALANNNRSFLGEPEKLLAQAVAIEPNSQKALWLLGMTFYERKDFTKTNELWTKLYDLMGDEGAKKQLAEQLAGVRSQLGLLPQEKPKINEHTGENKNTNALITINIHIDEMLIDKLKDNNGLLYIYTKATEGMPMPIAVIKKPLNEVTFPIIVSLSDSNNLQATRKLSGFEKITLGARISFDGNAIAQAGDLQSEEHTIKLPSSDTINLLIDATIQHTLN